MQELQSKQMIDLESKVENKEIRHSQQRNRENRTIDPHYLQESSDGDEQEDKKYI